MSSKEKLSLLPKLRFPEFRKKEGWPIELLGNICEPQQWTTISSSELVEKGYPVYGANGFIGYYTHFNHEFETVAVTCRGSTCGEVTLVPPRSYITGNSMCLDGIDDTSNSYHFVYQALKHRGFKDIISGSAQPQIVGNAIKKIEIALPKRTEQQKIADCLSSLDELIAAQARKVDALKTHKKGLMQQLFPREGETQPRLRFPEFRDAGRWKKMTLGSAANFYNGRAYKQEELLEAGKYKVLRVGNFFTNNNWYHSNLELDETKYCEDGDLLYAWSASFGPRIWHGEKTIYHYHIWKVVEQPGIDRQFLFIILEHETERMKAKTTNGLGIMHITKGAIESWESFFPGLAEQKKIADRLMTLDGAIGAEARKLESLTEHKIGLMQQLFPSIDDIKI